MLVRSHHMFDQYTPSKSSCKMATKTIFALAALLCSVQAFPSDVAASYGSSADEWGQWSEDLLENSLAQFENYDTEMDTYLDERFTYLQEFADEKAGEWISAAMRLAYRRKEDPSKCIPEQNPMAQISTDLLADLRECINSLRGDDYIVKNSFKAMFTNFLEAIRAARKALRECSASDNTLQSAACYLPWTLDLVNSAKPAAEGIKSIAQIIQFVSDASVKVDTCLSPSYTKSVSRAQELIETTNRCIDAAAAATKQ